MMGLSVMRLMVGQWADWRLVIWAQVLCESIISCMAALAWWDEGTVLGRDFCYNLIVRTKSEL